MTDAERAWLGKTEIGKAIVSNYDNNAGDDKDFAVRQLRRSIENNKDALGAPPAKAEAKPAAVMDAKAANKVLGMDAALGDAELRRKMAAWEAHRDEPPGFAQKADAAKAILAYRAAKGKADAHATEVAARPKANAATAAKEAAENDGTPRSREGLADVLEASGEVGAEDVGRIVKGATDAEVSALFDAYDTDEVGAAAGEVLDAIARREAKADADAEAANAGVKKDGGASSVPTDEGFAAWATGRDGKPMAFASEEERANARSMFDGLVRRGRVDGKTGRSNVRWSKVADAEEIRRLDNDPKGYVEAFASAQIGEDGNLYSPMAKVVRGKATPIAYVRDGKVIPSWQKSDEFSDIAFMKDKDDRKLKAGQENLAKRDKDTGDIAYFFTLRKGKGEGTVDARYNPYWHSVSSPLNDQFTTAYRRGNLVTVKVRIPISDLESGYWAKKAKDGVGVHPWKSGDVSTALAEAGRPRRDLMLSQYRQITEIVPDEVVAKNIIDFIGDADVEIPVNTMTPGVRELLRGKVKFADPNGNASQQAAARKWLEKNRVRWSVNWKENENWNGIIDKYEKGELKSGQHLVLLRSTPAVLKKLGVPDLPITINKNIIDKITGIVATKSGERHGIRTQDLRNLQIEMDNPIAVFDSDTDKDSKVILTRIIDRQNNEKAVVSVRINASHGAINVNAISSAYGKNKPSIDLWIAKNRMLYVNKQARKTSARWLQLPSDSVLRARSVLTEKDFPNELLGIIQYPVAERQPPVPRSGPAHAASRTKHSNDKCLVLEAAVFSSGSGAPCAA